MSIHVPRYSRSATAHSVRYPRVRLPREDRTEDMHEKRDPALVAMLQGPSCADTTVYENCERRAAKTARPKGDVDRYFAAYDQATGKFYGARA